MQSGNPPKRNLNSNDCPLYITAGERICYLDLDDSKFKLSRLFELGLLQLAVVNIVIILNREIETRIEPLAGCLIVI